MQDIRNEADSMAEEEQPRQPSHRVYAVIRREGQDEYWLNVGLAFPHKDGAGFNVILQALPLDGKVVCREITDDDTGEQPPPTRTRREATKGGQSGRRR
ncbi:MAG: hypothetical protein JO267_10950 [Alphaproteobacteria bacterium]|nr:hypothetical protein [Alphaproteobacteria bacterium]